MLKPIPLKCLLLSIFIVLSLAGSSQNKIFFNGKITNSPASKLEVFKLDKSQEVDETQKVKISKDGSFSTVIFSEKPVVIKYWIKHKTLEFYVSPGDSLTLKLEFKSKSITYSYSGKGQETARFFGRWKTNFKSAHRLDNVNKEKLSPETYLESREKLLSRELYFLNHYAETNGLTENDYFIKYYKTEFQFNFYSDIRDYITRHNNIKEEGMKIEYLPLVELLDSVDYNNPDFIETEKYRYYLFYYIKQLKYYQLIYDKVLPPVLEDSVHWTVRCYSVAFVTLGGKAFENAVITLLFELINPFTVSVLAPIYEHLIQNCSLENRLILEKSFSKYKRLSKNHKIHRKSNLFVTSDSFNESISKYKGYLLYVDFWASWCAPCIEEMSSSKEVQKKIKSKKIKFLFFSIDDDEDSWKKAISLYKIPGIHFRLNKEDADNMQKELLSKGIPHYLIVGKNGEILDFNAKRPSDIRLIQELKKILSE